MLLQYCRMRTYRYLDKSRRNAFESRPQCDHQSLLGETRSDALLLFVRGHIAGSGVSDPKEHHIGKLKRTPKWYRVRFGSEADICAAKRYVRYYTESRHSWNGRADIVSLRSA